MTLLNMVMTRLFGVMTKNKGSWRLQIGSRPSARQAEVYQTQHFLKHVFPHLPRNVCMPLCICMCGFLRAGFVRQLAKWGIAGTRRVRHSYQVV